MQQTGLGYNKTKINKIVSEIKNIKIKPADVTVTAIVLLLVCLVIVPSIVRCVINSHTTACTKHMSSIMKTLSAELQKETEEGNSYYHDMITNGNYRKLINSINFKTGESEEYPSSDYYIRTGDEVLYITCVKHKDAKLKELRFSVTKTLKADIAQIPDISDRIVYLSVSGQDTYYVQDSQDIKDSSEIQFTDREANEAIRNLKVSAVYAGGKKVELNNSQYTVTTGKPDMTRPGQTRLIIKADSTSLWDNSAYATFVINVTYKDDDMPLVVDGGANGKYELAGWDWEDFVYESSLEDGGKTFGASIVRYNGDYYYYPNGMRIINEMKNSSPFDFAFDVDDESKSAYCIKFDTDSVILTDSDADKIHNGSLKVENELVYIWQDVASKELPAGWTRIYCELKKY